MDTTVAAVDFQYTGGGVGIQDVAYFIERSLHGSGELMTAEEFSTFSENSLDYYFAQLRQSINVRVAESQSNKWHSDVQLEHSKLRCCFSNAEIDAIEAEWRCLYPVAMADLTRMWAGWTRPGASSHGVYIFPNAVVRQLVQDGMNAVLK